MEGMIGEIRMFGGNFAPRTWAFCQGQLLSINQNSALFSIIGTVYGGDGRSTFALPDLRGRCAIGAGHGAGLSNRNLGAKGGEETETLTLTQIPSHNHGTTTTPGNGPSSATVKVNAATTATTNSPTDAIWATDAAAPVYGNRADTTMAENAVEISNIQAALPNVEVNKSGGSQSHNNMQPWLSINYIICLQGIYPSRS